MRNSAELEFGLTPVASNWHLYLPQGQASAYKGSSIEDGHSAYAMETSAFLLEDSRPQAILKLQPLQHLIQMPAFQVMLFAYEKLLKI